MSESENEIDPIRNGEMFENYLAVKKNCEKKKKRKKDPEAKSAKEWTDDETSLLTDMLEANPCLWDIYHTDYSKRDSNFLFSLVGVFHHLSPSILLCSVLVHMRCR